MRTTLLAILLIIGFTPKTKAQLGAEAVELMFYYFMSWEEVSVQAETRPSLNNTFFSYGVRGGHTNASGNFTGGMSFHYSRDNNHGLIQQGSFTNYHIGAYFEKKFRLMPDQRLYLSVPVTIAFGESIANDQNPPPNFLARSTFIYLEPEVLLNYGLTKDVQLYFGPGYRHCSGSKTYGMTDDMISGLSIQVGFRFGDFR